MNDKFLVAGAAPLPAQQCALCLGLHKLSYSHVIPNAYFRAMKRPSNGKLVAMNTLPNSLVSLSQDSFADYLLCAGCERHIGKWETPWIRKLRKTAKLFTKDVKGVDVASFEYETFRCFLISIIWRAAVCTRKEFKLVKFPDDVLERLRADLYAGRAPKDTVIGNRIRKIVDPSGRLNFENLACAPITLSSGGLQGYQLFFGGYVVDFITSKITRRVTKIAGFVQDRPSLTIPAAPFKRERNLMAIGRQMVNKNSQGKVTFGQSQTPPSGNT